MPNFSDRNIVSDTNGSVIDPLYQTPDVGGIRAMQQNVTSGIGQALGVPDIMSALTGGMTPEEAQMFALGSVPLLLAPEAKAAEGVTRFVGDLGKYAEEVFSEGGATIHKLQKPGRWPTYVTTAPDTGERFQYRDFEQAKRSIVTPEIQRPDPALPGALPPWEEPIRAYHGSPLVFDDKLIDIVKKYGMAGLIAGGAWNWSPDQAQAGEKGQIEPGNIDLHSRPTVHNPDGTISTVRSITITDDQGRAILIPTVVGNRVVSNKEAEDEYYRTGQHLGIFGSIKDANAYAKTLHEQQAKEYSPRYKSMGRSGAYEKEKDY